MISPIRRISPAAPKPPPVRITVRTGSGVTVLALSGDLDSSTLDFFCEELLYEIENSRHPVIIDLDGVTFCTCRGLSALVAASRAARAADVPLVIVTSQRAVVRPIRLLGLDRTLDLRRGSESLPWTVS